MPHPFALGSHTKWAAIRLIFFCLQKCAKNPRPFAFAIACQWPLGSLTKRAAIYLLFFRLQKCAEISRAFALVATWQSHKTGSNLPSFFLYSETHRNFTSLCTRSFTNWAALRFFFSVLWQTVTTSLAQMVAHHGWPGEWL